MDEGHKGKLVYWYENGKKKEEIEYEDGIENGIYRYYGSDGVKYVDGIFTKNIPSDKWTFYNKSGSKIIEIDYDVKNLVAKWRSWYSNGNKHAQGEFSCYKKYASFTPPTILGNPIL